MLDGQNTGRARLFDNLRYESLVETSEPSEPAAKQIKPMTAEQADAFRDMAVRSLQPR